LSITGGCRCNNLRVTWHTKDYSGVPRACVCDYCRARGAAYVSKSGTAVEVRIHNKRRHAIVTHGSHSAEFHECGACGDLVVVTAQIDGETYGALNARCLDNKHGFAAAVAIDYSGHTTEQKRLRWRQNWCSPVRTQFLGSE
jgi:hypothetical protein